LQLKIILHFIWQFQFYNKSQLTTVDGEDLQIIKQGTYNVNQGPDFSNGNIKIDTIVLAGNIEIHINASDWLKHGHTNDSNYSNIILHVVWNNDKPILITGKPVPTLELQSRVSKILLQRYELLVNNKTSIPCASFLPALSEIGWTAWKERLAAERLEHKATLVLDLYEQSNHHWEEVFWWMIARNFGIKVNADVFEAIAKTISINILAKHKNQIHQLEALLFGQANLLNENFADDYPKLLQKEYAFYQSKYKLTKPKATPLFLRMRPATFPTIRLAQLAMLIHNSTHLFAKIKDIDEVKQLHELLNVTANDYWHYHYQFDVLNDYAPKNLGKQMMDNIIINTIIPVLFAYGQYNKQQQYKDKAINWLQQLGAESNTITKKWKALSVDNTSSFDSQSLIHLTNQYCATHNCLQCAVGNKILKNS
jgi:Protein of unknown function (DUF2851)